MAIVLTSTENMPYTEWLDWRKKGIGGSDASVVCRVNKYKSPVELWMEKTGQLTYQESGEAAYWGTQLESLVRNEFTKRTGIDVVTKNQILQSEKHTFMFANLDGMCEHPDFGQCIFEAKTASAYKASEWDNKIPNEYMLQIQHYMSVTDSLGAYIAVLIGGNTFKWYFVNRDEKLIAMLIQKESEFWRCIETNTPPSIDGSDASAKLLNKQFPCSLPTSVNLSNHANELIKQHDKICEQIKTLTEQKQKCENLLKQMLGDNEAGAIGSYVVTWKSVTQERFDSKALKAEHPKLYKKYINRTSHRRFSIGGSE